MPKGPLSGIRVVDWTHWQVGTTCDMLMAFLGAEVIKVESFTHMDRYRQNFGPQMQELERPYDRSQIFHAHNEGKLSVQFNLKHPKGLALMKELLAHSDVLAYNMRQVAADKVGLDYETVRAVNPNLVVVSMSNSGTTGPERDYYGYAPTFAALGGISHLSGYPDYAPCEHTGWPDNAVGTWGALAILSGLHIRQRTGKGTFIDCSGREAFVWMAPQAFMDYTLNRRVRGRVGNRDDIMAPHNAYRCQGEEKWIAIAVGSDAEWQALCEVMGRPAWTSDERFATTLKRWHNQAELDKLVEEWTRQHDQVELLEKLQAAGVAATPSYSNEDIYGNPHLWEREFFKFLEHPLMGSRTVSGPPWRLTATPADVPRAAPMMGQHNEYVLHDILGHSSEEIESLTAEGVIY